MGIQDLTKSIKKHAPDAITTLKPSDLPGTVYGVDVYSYLYPAKYNPGAKGKGQHIRFFFDMIVAWTQANKKLVMIFDGNTSAVTAKMDTVIKRQEVRQHNKDIITEMTNRIDTGVATQQDVDDLERATRNSIKISQTDTDDLKQLFSFLGVTYYQAQGEADIVLAAMYSAGTVHGVISEDSDMLTHGIGIVVRGLIDAGNRTAGVVRLFQLSKILEGFGMSMTQFIDFCILSGCDYCPRVSGTGPVGAFKHIQAGGTPLTLTIPPDEVYELKYREAVRMFTEHTDNPDPVNGEGQPGMSNLKTWLLENTNITEKTVDEKLRVLSTQPAPVPVQITAKPRPKILPKK